MKTARDILVIDDEPVVTKAVRMICEAEGWSVDAAYSGAVGLKLLEICDYRLIICDIMMTDVDGFQFLAEAARLGLTTPVVMATGYATVENAVKSLAQGAADFIAKPFTTDEILTVARRAIRCAELHKEAAAAGREHLPYVPCPPQYHRLGDASWVKTEAVGDAVIGVNDVFLKAIESVGSVELLQVNEEVAQGGPCATLVTARSERHGVMCPIGGRIVSVNPAVKASAAIVEKDPYFSGWLYRVVPTDLQSDLRNLVACSSDRI